MKAVAGVLFDKDGVLVDFHRTWGPACGRVVRHFASGDGQARQMAAAIDFDLDAELFAPTSPFIAGTGVDTLMAWAPILDIDANPHLVVEIIDRMTAEGVACVGSAPEVAPALDALRGAGLPLGIATNDQEDSARRQMEVLGLVDRFSLILGSNSGHGAKPKPGMVLAFAAHLGTGPERVAMVGDSLHDLNAAKAAGAVAIAIGTGPADLDDLAPHADHVIETMAELPGVIAGLGG